MEKIENEVLENEISNIPDQDKPKSTRDYKGWVAVLGVLIILALGMLAIVNQIKQVTQKAVDPVSDMTGNLATQVHQILNPTPTILPNRITIIHEIRSLARLETIQYSVEKVIFVENNTFNLPALFGDKLIFVAHGEVVAGVDLSEISQQDLKIVDGTLYVDLPPTIIFSTYLNESKSYVYNRDTGLLTKGDINLESTARSAALEEIGKAAREDGIIDLARNNAENYLRKLFIALGYKSVIFENP